MPTQINKLDPTVTLSLRGFDGFGANAAITKSSSTGFTVSGVFRAADDFAVLVLYDTDDFFEHPRNKYLPDPSLAGMVLEFDATFTNLQPLDSAKFPTIDWPYLDVAKWDGTRAQIVLFDNATQNGGTYSQASRVLTVAASPAVAFDRVTIWYENNAADFIAVGGETADTVASNLATQINGWADLEASASGPNITITARKPGRDGNMIRLYTQSKTATLQLSESIGQLAGGSSDATWHVRLDFSALGIDQVRQMWLTFAPALADSAAYADAEWTAVFTNWQITADPLGNAPLKVAGPGSVRVEETDAWCSFSGDSWTSTSGGGFYSQGFARVASAIGDSVTITYWCQQPHDLWIGTALYVDRGQVSILIDGAAQPNLDTFLNDLEPVVTRRKIASGLAAGKHTVTIALLSGLFYFDYLEAVVASDVPDALDPLPDLTAALDYDTDSTYKISPQRLLRTFDNLGLAGPMNLYLGVFWWNQRKAVGGNIPTVQIDFSQRTYSAGTGVGDGDQVFVVIGGQAFGKTVFPADDAASIAAHFAYFLNENSVGVWAAATGTGLTIANRSAGTAFSFTFSASVNLFGGGTADLAFIGELTGGVQPDWHVDPSQTPAIARGARDWQADLYSEVYSRGLTISTALSMELVFPPDDPAASQVWVQRWPDNVAVGTDTGFSSLVSMQCSFVSAVLAYHQAAFAAIAGLQLAAGLVPCVQFGEFSWWYFPDAAGMAFYDAETSAAAAVALGRPLHVFATPNDDPSANLADSQFIAGRLSTYVQNIVNFLRAAHPTILVEWLLPMDVNFPTVVGKFNLGGRLLYAVNVPGALISPATTPFDLLKIECLDFGAADRNMNLSAAALAFGRGQGWAKSQLRYLLPLENGGCPFLTELGLARGYGYPAVVLWAYDHLQLYGWDVRKIVEATAQVV